MNAPVSLRSELAGETHNPLDPNPIHALQLDQSVPIAPIARNAMIANLHSRSRRVLLPVVRLLAGVLIRLLGVIRLVVPRFGASSKWLHKSIHWGLRTFVRRDANLLILRHFHLGSQVLGFIADNAGIDVKRRPLAPKALADVENNLFVEHDINLFNFVIELNQGLNAKGGALPAGVPLEKLSFASVTDTIELDRLPDRWTNVLDLETAIHLYTPIYQWFLTDREFSRAVASLQLDETISIYIATLLGSTNHLHLISNRHALVATRRVDAAHDLVLHGLGTERLHRLLVDLKNSQ